MFDKRFARLGGHDEWEGRARFSRHEFRDFFRDHFRDQVRGRFGAPRRRGDAKYEMLAILAEGPRHGYDLMLEMERRTGNKPSPGSIYPTLQALEEGGFLQGREHDGKRVYEITDTGRQLLGDRPKSEDGEGFFPEGMGEVYTRAAMAQRSVMGASKEVFRSADLGLVEKLAEILEATRKEIYTLLAESR